MKLDLPPLIENGNAVPLTVDVESPMTAADHVRAIHVFTEKNPQPNVASFHLGPRAGRASVATRIRLADTQTVVAIARAERRLVLVGQRRRRGHPRRVPRGRPSDGARAHQRAGAGQARRGHRDQDPHLAPDGDRLRRTQLGALIPRDIIRRSSCTYNGAEVFRAELHPAIAANPFIAFSTVATESGTLEFHWTGDNGFSVTRDRRDHRRLSGAPARRGRAGASRRGRRRRGEIPRAERRSGYDFMSRETRAMQDDDTANPGMLWVLEGEALWNRKAGAAGRACADCHGDARASMKGVAARHPAFDAAQRAAGRSRAAHQRLPRRAAAGAAARLREPGAAGADRLRRAPVARPADRDRDRRAHAAVPRRGPDDLPPPPGPAQPRLRQCHDDNWGRQLAGNVIPQAHPTGYPLYRLEWQGLGSLQRRLRNCLVGIRAEPYEYGAPELVELELYLMWRARGMLFEAPGVRP